MAPAQKGDLEQVVLPRKEINRIDTLDRLSEVAAPALILVGEEFGQSFAEMNRKLAEALPNAEFVTLEQAMDPSNLVNPEAFDHQVLRFLAQHPV